MGFTSRFLLLGLCGLLAGCGDNQPSTAIHPEQWPAQTSPIPASPALEAKIDALLGAMTLEQKVGQVIQADIASVTPDEVRHYKLGSVLNGGSSAPGGKAFAPGPEWLALADAFYDAAKASDGPWIPVLWGSDAVHGHNNVIGATLFPHNIGLGAARDPELMREIGAVTAVEVAVTGIDWSFAPTLAVARDDRWGRTYESFSENPEIVRAYAGMMVEGLQGKVGSPEFLDRYHVIANAKHFLGDGGTDQGRDQGDTLSSETELRDIHAAGYPPALAAGTQVVMASYNSWHGNKMHGFAPLLTGVLKHRWGFDGFVVGDWNGHGQVKGCTVTDCPAALNAGLDMVMAPDSWKALYHNLVEDARDGTLDPARLDDAVRRIVRVKFRAGLFDAPRPSARPLAGDWAKLGAPPHRAVARRAVRQSLVLLKNQGQILPLKATARILVVGDGADHITQQSGGWTLDWQGRGHQNSLFPNATSIFAGIKAAVAAEGGDAVLSIDGSYQTRPDVAILVYGESPYAEFQGDRKHLGFDDPDTLALLRKLDADGVPVVSVFLSGRPLWVNPYLNLSAAFVAAWLPGSEGAGIADVLIGDQDGKPRHDFRGRLSFSWPKKATGEPLNPGDPGYDPLFPYGYGLAYGEPGDLATLDEDSGLDASAAGDPNQLFAHGRLRPDLDFAFPSEAVEVHAVDHARQEDARSIVWKEAGFFAFRARQPIDLRREANGDVALAFDLRRDGQETAVAVALGCGDDCGGDVDLSPVVAGLKIGEWRRVSILLKCFAAAGADLARLDQPFGLHASKAAAFSLSDVTLDQRAPDSIACAP